MNQQLGDRTVHCEYCGQLLGYYVKDNESYYFRPLKSDTRSVSGIGHFCNDDCKRKKIEYDIS